MFSYKAIASTATLLLTTAGSAFAFEERAPAASMVDDEAKLIEQQKAWGAQRRAEYQKREEEWRLLDSALEWERQSLIDTAKKMKLDKSSSLDDPVRAHYVRRIGEKIRSYLVVPSGLEGNPESWLDVDLLPNGQVRAVVLMKSSGSALYDAAVNRALLAAQPLPIPSDPDLFDRYFRHLNLRFRPFPESANNALANGPNLKPQDDTSARAEYSRAVSMHIRRYQKYPLEALANNLEGTAQVAVQFGESGDVVKITLQKSSGWPILDSEAFTMVWAAAPQIRVPTELQGRVRTLIVPIFFHHSRPKVAANWAP